MYPPKRISIEVCSACNHRCVYCPVHGDPFPQRTMDLEAFERILDELSGLRTIQRISFNHYNEPFLDRLLVERIRRVVERKMTRRIILYTNASVLTSEHVEQLKEYRRCLDFSINLPTVRSAAGYRELHGADHLDRVRRNVERLLAARFHVRINVQRNEFTNEDDWDSVQKAYGDRVRWIESHSSSTRANLVLSRTIGHRGNLLGCRQRRHKDYLHIGVDGAVFLCAEDYHKNYAFGNLLYQSLETVLASPRRLRSIEYIDGKTLAPDDFICRSCAYARVPENGSMAQRVRDALNSRLVRPPIAAAAGLARAMRRTVSPNRSKAER